MDYRFIKAYRLSARSAIDALFAQGVRAGDEKLLLIARRREEPGPTRVLMAVSKKHGNAVKRNRLKRLCREAFRLERPDLPTGWDVAMLPRVGRKQDLASLRASLRTLMETLES